jgi:hypothetical protein
MTHDQFVVYADDVKALEDNTNTIKIKTEAMSDSSKEVGLEVNREN